MPAPVALSQLSFAGVRDSLDPSTAEPRKAAVMENVYPSDTFIGAAVVGRPGFRQAGSLLVSSARVQGIAQYTKLDGTETTVAFCAGQMFTFNWFTRFWANVVLTGGAELSSVAPIATANFANTLIVSDGIHTPFQWDGTTFTVLTNCPVLYGPPTVYYAKLFGVKNADRTTFVWSEENDPTTGYEAGGFNNAWTLGQTQQDALHRLLGTNAALYYWRERSWGYISGAVTTDFVSAGTREAGSETIGTRSPGAVVFYENRIYFLSADGQPYVIQIGGGMTPLWSDLRETLSAIPRSSLSKAVGVGDPLTQMVLLGLVEANQGEVTLLVAVDTRTNLIGGTWRGFTPTALGVVKDDNLVPRIMHGTVNGSTYDHGDPNGSVWNDQNSAADGGTLPISHTVKGTPLGYDLQFEKVFDRIDIALRLQTDIDTVIVDYETPRGISAGQSVHFAGILTGDPDADPIIRVFVQWDVGVWDTDTWPSDELERHFALGWNGRGRWCMPRIRHGNAAERFGLLGWTVTAIPEGLDPAIP